VSHAQDTGPSLALSRWECQRRTGAGHARRAQSATEFIGMLMGAALAERLGPPATAYIAAAVIAACAVLATRVGPAQPLSDTSDN